MTTNNGAVRHHTPSRRPSDLRKQQPIFSSARTAWILSFLVLLTLLTQIILVANHDDFVHRLNTLEGELLEDMVSLNSMATDTVNAAYEYNDPGAGEGSSAGHNYGFASEIGKKERTAVMHSTYSMAPEDILKRARVDSSAGYVPSTTVSEARAARNAPAERKEAELPSLDEIQAMYGNRSYILGLDTCEAFKGAVVPEHRLMGPAGMFNSATNLLNRLLKLNCENQARLHKHKGYRQPRGIMLQAPWGKHNPVAWRLHHEASVGGKGVQQADFLPIVMVKDPITWMASMCRHSYEARWRHVKEHCPNLVPNKWDKGRRPGEGTVGMKVKFATQHIGDEPIPDKRNKTFVEFSSLVDLWNVWYGEWHDANFPRLMVRFEDLMFHAEDTISQICFCGGGTMKRKFSYVEESAKGDSGPHAGSAGFLASLVTYGNSTLRNKGILTDETDLEYARHHLDKELMEMFGYAPI